MNKTTNTSGFNQALWLGISQASTFLLAFVSSAILSRYFDKEEYGTYKQVLYIYATLQTVFTAGLPGVFSYFIPRMSEGQGKTLVTRITNIFFLLGLLFSLVLFTLSDIISNILENPELSLALKVFSPFPLLTIPTMGVEGIYTALKKTKFIAIYQTISKLGMLLFIVLPVIIFRGTYITAIIGWGLAALLTFVMAMWMKRRPYVGITPELIPGMYKAVFNYSLPLMSTSFVGMALHSSNQFFISRYYGTEAFANFSNGFIPLPFVAMIAGSVKSVLLPIFSKAQANNTINEALSTYTKALKESIILIYPILILIFFYSDNIVIFLFGDKYSASATYLRISLFKDLFEVFPYYAILLAFGKTKIYFNIHLLAAVGLWSLSYMAAILDLGPYAISALSVLSQSSIIAMGLIYIIRTLKLKILNKSTFIIVITILFTTILSGIISKSLVEMMHTHNLIKIALGGSIYYALIISTGKILNIDYLSSFKRIVKY